MPSFGEMVNVGQINPGLGPSLIVVVQKHMLAMFDAFEVIEPIVSRIAVLMVDNISIGNRPNLLFPNSPMQSDDSTRLMPEKIGSIGMAGTIRVSSICLAAIFA